MPRGGSHPGERRGGRKRGVPNKASAAKAKSVAESGLTPLDFMIATMRDKNAKLADRLDAAKSVAPYIHPKLATVTLAGDPENPLQIATRHATDAERAAAILALKRKLAER